MAFAQGQETNIFLNILDISYNGLGDPGATAVGKALKTSSVLQELNMSNYHISVRGSHEPRPGPHGQSDTENPHSFQESQAK